MPRKNSYRNSKVGSVREYLGTGVLWTSYMLVNKKKKTSLLKALYSKGEKGDRSRSKFWEERQPLDLRSTVR